ncbi:MAG: hypothetical protein ACK52I_30925 [Pseudomonadota bacterium]|jgi:hypothetical protein
MKKFNSEKTISANANGIVISYSKPYKKKFVKYESEYVKNVQIHGTVKYQKLQVETTFNDKQKDLYLKTILGFNAYSKEELTQMSENKKQLIAIQYTKTKRILNKWKQEILFKGLDDLLLFLFPKSPIIKDMVNTTGYLKEYDKADNITFEEIGISKNQIVSKLMSYGILPKNFYELT